jgi:hypothetical protein
MRPTDDRNPSGGDGPPGEMRDNVGLFERSVSVGQLAVALVAALSIAVGFLLTEHAKLDEVVSRLDSIAIPKAHARCN